jgi:hypothetical protein
MSVSTTKESHRTVSGALAATAATRYPASTDVLHYAEAAVFGHGNPPLFARRQYLLHPFGYAHEVFFSFTIVGEVY